MGAINIRAVDLNLLAVLDALLDEAHVTRAATRLGLSQAAASNALERCRYLFGDPLLERAGRRMRLTPRAEALKPELRAVIADIEAVLTPGSLDLTTIQRTVRIITADIMSALLASPMHQALSLTAPGINLAYQPWQGAEIAVEALERGSSDLAISIFAPLSGDLRSRKLFDERYVVIMRRGHPAALDFNLDRWLAWPHLIVSASGDTRGSLDDILLPFGKSRRVGMAVPSFSMVPEIVRQTDLIALTPTQALGGTRRDGLHIFEPPLPIPAFALSLAWHRRRDDDPVVQHVAEAVGAALAKAARPLVLEGQAAPS